VALTLFICLYQKRLIDVFDLFGKWYILKSRSQLLGSDGKSALYSLEVGREMRYSIPCFDGHLGFSDYLFLSKVWNCWFNGNKN
jgi:hypothetical protein